MIQTGKDVLTMIRIGVVNIDVSHPKTFSEAYKTIGRARYAAVYNEGFRGPEEVEGFRKMAGLDKVCASLEELVDACNVGFVQGCDWDKHLAHAMAFINAGKPVFIDKPLAGNLADCEKLLALERAGAVILGSSSVRYCDEIRNFLDTPREARGDLLHVSMTVGVDEFNYAIHAAEGLCALAASTPGTVRWLGNTRKDGQDCDSYFITFESGATASCHCVAPQFLLFHTTILASRGSCCFTIDNSKLYYPMLTEICNKLEGKENRLVPVSELIWPIRVLLAGKLSRQRGGEEISVLDPALEYVSFDGGKFAQGYAAAAKPMYL